MGYRSDVRIIVSKKGYNQLKKFNDNYLKTKNIDSSLLDDPDFFHDGKNGVCIGWNFIKWYEESDFHEVNAIVKGLDDLRDKDMSYRIARIGENYDDYEERYHESNIEEEQDIAYPSVIRQFDDDDIIKELDYVYSNDLERGDG